jgi:hypothetical protein
MCHVPRLQHVQDADVEFRAIPSLPSPREGDAGAQRDVGLQTQLTKVHAMEPGPPLVCSTQYRAHLTALTLTTVSTSPHTTTTTTTTNNNNNTTTITTTTTTTNNNNNNNKSNRVPPFCVCAAQCAAASDLPSLTATACAAAHIEVGPCFLAATAVFFTPVVPHPYLQAQCQGSLNRPHFFTLLYSYATLKLV